MITPDMIEGLSYNTPHKLHGRRIIYTTETEVTQDNVLQVLYEALAVHMINRQEIDYLHNYIRGRQPILNRTKQVRDDICNKVVINLANQTVAFKTSNFIGDPLQYISRGTDEHIPGEIEKLNSFMMSENKASKDIELAHWMFTCGVGYRLVLRDKAEEFMVKDRADELYDEAPFEIYTLDPRDTFVIRTTDVTKAVVAAVTCTMIDDRTSRYTVYTPNEKFYIKAGYGGLRGRKSSTPKGEIEQVITHNSGIIPIIEYPCNSLRMGAFEPGISILDAINNIQSNRLDGVEQFIQAVMVFENVDIDKEQLEELKSNLALKITSKDGNVAKVYYLNEQLDQSQTELLVNDLILLYYEIVGMPSQGDGSTSDSSNNGAIAMKNGWMSANARTLETDWPFRSAETDMLRIILQICREVNALELKLSEVDMKFGLRAYEDMLTKTQSFVTLIGAGCSPLQAAKISCITADPESFAIEYEEYNSKNAEPADAEQPVENEDAGDEPENQKEEVV